MLFPINNDTIHFMLNLKILINIVQPQFAKKFLYILLLLSFIPVLDCILILNLAVLIGNYLFLAILMLLSLFGFFISLKVTANVQKQLHSDLETHTMNLNHYNSLPGSFTLAFLLIMPGMISTILGLIFIIPPLMRKLGSLVSRILKIDWKEIHEYMNIID